MAIDVADALATASQTTVIRSLADLDAESLQALLDRLAAAPGATQRLS